MRVGADANSIFGGRAREMVRRVLVHFGLQAVRDQKEEGCKKQTIRIWWHSLMFVGISFSFDNIQSKQLHFVSYTTPVCGTNLRITWKDLQALGLMIFTVCAQSKQKRDNSFYVCTPMFDFSYFHVLAVPHRTLSGKNLELDERPDIFELSGSTMSSTLRSPVRSSTSLAMSRSGSEIMESAIASAITSDVEILGASEGADPVTKALPKRCLRLQSDRGHFLEPPQSRQHV